jgi:hypothetical protein
MTGFKKRFFTSLQEEVGASPVDASPVDDEEAFNRGLDPDTSPEVFDDVPDNPQISIQKQQTAESINTLQSWITEVESFIMFLNGLEESSMNYQLNKADCDSIMADVRRSESKKISRLAQDLSSLGESLKQYLLSADNDHAS